MMGNAKRMATYLGEPPRPPSLGRVLPAGPISIAASAQQSAQLGTMIAMAVTTSQTKIQLNGGSDKRPTMNQAIKWLKNHVDKANVSGCMSISTVFSKLQSDIG